jgi:hypothetical protein
MKLERSRVDHPLWRKKVDKSLFEYKGTTIPTWACDMWGIQSQFKKVTSKKDKNADVVIRFGKKEYPGWVTIATKKRKTPAYRLWFNEDLSTELKHEYVMSYMRMLEQGLNQESVDIEDEIPFWEFLDIEYARNIREFTFVAYYRQKPSFPNLFDRLIGSPTIASIDDEIQNKDKNRIHKQDWKDRSELPFELGAENVIYVLADTEHKFLYVGEAKNLVKRLSKRYSVIPHWNMYRYDVLPKSLGPFRVTLERMLIRSFATLFESKKGHSSLNITGWKLANEKIDK